MCVKRKNLRDATRLFTFSILFPWYFSNDFGKLLDIVEKGGNENPL